MKKPRRSLSATTGLVLLAVTLASQTVRSSTITPFASIPDSAFRPVDIHEVFFETSPPEPIPPIPEPTYVPQHAPHPIAIQVPKSTTEPKPKSEPAIINFNSHSISGLASWYCLPGRSICTHGYPASGAYAAAGPRLRAAIGPNWRGRVVRVNGVAVRLIDWCQCYRGERYEKLLDLYHSVFIRTGSKVTITW